MKKEEFLEVLEPKLYLLTETERKKIIKKYKTIITKKAGKKDTEETVIASFGDVDILVQKILDDYGIKTDNKKENKYFGEFLKAFNNVIDYISKQNLKAILKLILEILIIIIFICFLKLPFILFRDLLLNFFEIMGIEANSIVNLLIIRISDIIYTILAVVMFIGIFSKRFAKLQKKI